MNAIKWSIVYIAALTNERDFIYWKADKVFSNKSDCLKYINKKNSEDWNDGFVDENWELTDKCINDWRNFYWELQIETVI